MTDQTPGCGSTSDARKRQAEQETPIPTGDAALYAHVRALEAELAQVKAEREYIHTLARKAIVRTEKAEAERDEWKSECLRWRDEAEAGNFDALKARAESAEAERDRLRDVVARVEGVKRQGAAEALEQAADDVLAEFDPPIEACVWASEWLRDRAGQVRAGGDS